MSNDRTRKSTVVMLSVIGAAFLLVFILVLFGRFTVARFANADNGVNSSGNHRTLVSRDFSNMVTTEFEVRDFREVSFVGSWQVDIEQGDEWKVELTYPRILEKRLNVELKGDQLVLNPGIGRHSNWGWGWNWGWWNDAADNVRFTARITMPELVALNVSGSSNMDFSGFSGDDLSITITGAADIEGEDGHYENLNIIMSGAGNVDLKEMQVTDANVVLSGAGNVELEMDGGILSGQLSGFGNIEYGGTVKDQRVNVSGFGRVNHAD